MSMNAPLKIRVIPRLDIKGPNLVKGIHFEGLRVLGKPEEFAKAYYEAGADELIYMDAVASLYERNSLLDIVERTAREIFIPLTVGGGLRTLEDMRAVLRAGADKVSINTAALRDPNLIKEAAHSFGSSTVIVALEVIEDSRGDYIAYVDYGRESSGVNALQWAKQAVELGAGELMVTSIDRDGTGKGYDCELIQQIAEEVPVPVIAGGGAGKISHVSEVIQEGKADAVAVASLLHYRTVQDLQERMDSSYFDQFEEEGNIEFLKNQKGFGIIDDASIQEVKLHFKEQQIPCRPVPTMKGGES